MEVLRLIITICNIHTGTCYEDVTKLYPPSKAINGGTTVPVQGICMKSAMQVLPGKYDALSNSSYRIAKWKCKAPTS